MIGQSVDLDEVERIAKEIYSWADRDLGFLTEGKPMPKKVEMAGELLTVVGMVRDDIAKGRMKGAIASAIILGAMAHVFSQRFRLRIG